MADAHEIAERTNVMGGRLEACSSNPLTGFFRNGCCDTSKSDRGSHTVCCQVTDDFLSFSKARGNDLSTPRPEFHFPGLAAGDRWCLCAARFAEAHEAGHAPRVYLAATHEWALRIVPLDVLRQHAVDVH